MTIDNTPLQEYGTLPLPETKAELLERMAVAYEAAEALIAAYDEDTLTKPISEAGWSAKDYLAHIMTWEGSMVALLQKKPRHEAMGLDEELFTSSDYDASNDVLFRRHKDQSLQEVLTALRDTHSQLLALLADLTDEDLLKPYSLYQPHAEGNHINSPIIDWLAGDTYTHYAEHIIEIDDLINKKA